jgi:hypothetical protein
MPEPTITMNPSRGLGSAACGWSAAKDGGMPRPGRWDQARGGLRLRPPGTPTARA